MVDEVLLQQIRRALAEAEANGWRTLLIIGIGPSGVRTLMHGSVVEQLGGIELTKENLKRQVLTINDPIPGGTQN